MIFFTNLSSPDKDRSDDTRLKATKMRYAFIVALAGVASFVAYKWLMKPIASKSLFTYKYDIPLHYLGSNQSVLDHIKSFLNIVTINTLVETRTSDISKRAIIWQYDVSTKRLTISKTVGIEQTSNSCFILVSNNMSANPTVTNPIAELS